MSDRVDLAQRHAFEIAVWRDQSDDVRSWGWTIRLRGESVASSSIAQMSTTSSAAFAAGEARLLDLLRNRAESATADLRLVSANNDGREAR